MYYEHITLKDNFKLLIKKYRTLNTFTDLKAVANRLQELAYRAAKINQEYPVNASNVQIFDIKNSDIDIPTSTISH